MPQNPGPLVPGSTKKKTPVQDLIDKLTGDGYGASQHPIAPKDYSVKRTSPMNAGRAAEDPYDERYYAYGPPPKASAPNSAGPSPTSPVKNGGSPTFGGGAVGVNPAQSALDKMYASLTGSLKQTGVDNNALIDQSIGTIKGNYGDANADIYQQYQDSRNDLEGRAGNLGVDLDASKMGSVWDASMRRLQEVSDSNLNSDLSYMEKMRLIKQSAIESLLMGAEQDKMSRLAGMMGGGGGSSGGRGGSGGSSGTGTAGQTETVDNVGDIETYNELLRTDPQAAQVYWSAYLSNSLDPDASIGAMQTTKSKLPTKLDLGVFLLDKKKGDKVNSKVSKTLKNQKGAYDRAIQAMLGISGKGGNPKIQQKTTYKGK